MIMRVSDEENERLFYERLIHYEKSTGSFKRSSEAICNANS